MTRILAAALALVAGACGSGVESDAGTPEGAVLPAAGEGDAVGGNGLGLAPSAAVPEDAAAVFPDVGDEPDPIPVPGELHLAPDQPVAVGQVVVERRRGGEDEPPAAEPSASPTLQAVADLAGYLGVDREAIIVVSSEAVTWPDGSLGCPRSGMGYTQVLVDGMRIILTYGGSTYEYHSGGTRAPFLCRST